MFSKIKVEKLEQIIEENSDIVILISFSKIYSGESQILNASIKELVKEYEGKIQFYDFDAAKNAEYLAKKGVRKLPTLLIYHKTKLVHHDTGLHSKSHLRNIIEQHLYAEHEE